MSRPLSEQETLVWRGRILTHMVHWLEGLVASGASAVTPQEALQKYSEFARKARQEVIRDAEYRLR